MARVRLELDGETFGRLVEAAVAERRAANCQAEVILMRALGIPPPEIPSVFPSNTPPAPTDRPTDEAERVSS